METTSFVVTIRTDELVHVILRKRCQLQQQTTCQDYYRQRDSYLHEIIQWQRRHSEGANLRQRQNLKRTCSGIRIRIFGLIRVRIRMSVGSVPKCCGCITLSGSVISPSIWYKSAVDCMRNANKCPKIPYFAMVKKNEKVIRNPHAVPDHHQKLITFRGSPLAHAGQVWSTSVSAFASYPVYSMTE